MKRSDDMKSRLGGHRSAANKTTSATNSPPTPSQISLEQKLQTLKDYIISNTPENSFRPTNFLDADIATLNTPELTITPEMTAEAVRKLRDIVQDLHLHMKNFRPKFEGNVIDEYVELKMEQSKIPLKKIELFLSLSFPQQDNMYSSESVSAQNQSGTARGVVRGSTTRDLDLAALVGIKKSLENEKPRNEDLISSATINIANKKVEILTAKVAELQQMLKNCKEKLLNPDTANSNISMLDKFDIYMTVKNQCVIAMDKYKQEAKKISEEIGSFFPSKLNDHTSNLNIKDMEKAIGKLKTALNGLHEEMHTFNHQISEDNKQLIQTINKILPSPKA